MLEPEFKILIKQIESIHLSQVSALETLCFETPWSKEQFQDALNSSSYYLLGAFHTKSTQEESLLAYLLVTQIDDYAEIINIASHPEHRRKGLANTLLSHFFAENVSHNNIPQNNKLPNNILQNADKNAHSIQFSVSQKNVQMQIKRKPPVETILEVRSQNIVAQNLYKKFNFITIHTRKNYYKDDDALVMLRKG